MTAITQSNCEPRYSSAFTNSGLPLDSSNSPVVWQTSEIWGTTAIWGSDTTEAFRALWRNGRETPQTSSGGSAMDD